MVAHEPQPQKERQGLKPRLPQRQTDGGDPHENIVRPDGGKHRHPQTFPGIPGRQSQKPRQGGHQHKPHVTRGEEVEMVHGLGPRPENRAEEPRREGHVEEQTVHPKRHILPEHPPATKHISQRHDEHQRRNHAQTVHPQTTPDRSSEKERTTPVGSRPPVRFTP